MRVGVVVDTRRGHVTIATDYYQVYLSPRCMFVTGDVIGWGH